MPLEYVDDAPVATPATVIKPAAAASLPPSVGSAPVAASPLANSANRHLVLAIAAPALLAIGATVAIVRTLSGYSYSVVGNPALLLYVLAACLLAGNVMSDKLERELASRLQLTAMVLLAAVVVYGLYVSMEGVQWFYQQTAIDLPAQEGANVDAFWATLSGWGFHNSGFGTLRHVYEVWGPNVAVNDIPVYQNTINSLSQAHLRELIATGGGAVYWYPFGLLAFIGAVIAQLRLRAELAKANA